ncbi:MAG: flavodoxin [Roseburia sp.]|nr:flavodoxin [Roseburia sp.]
MKIRKSILLLTLMLALSFVLAACGNSNSSAETASAADETETVTEALQTEETAEDVSEETTEEPETTETESAETDADGGNVLVAYFSYTGNTKEVAQIIAEYTGGDLAEIQRAEEYGDLQEEAEAEILDGVHPEITVSVDSIEGYDTIFVGYPIWWDEAPAMIATFLTENDFSGKTIIPFCTSASDDIGNSLHIFSELCPDAEIAEGLTANDLNDIEPWIQGLGLME